MEQQEIREKVNQILTTSKTGVMSTVKGNKPHSRYMTFTSEGLTLYTPTSRETDKAEEISENPSTHILLGYEGEGFGDLYVEYEGQVEIKDDSALKEKLWSENMKEWFDGPNDPDLIILEIKPKHITLKNKKGSPSQKLEL